MLDLVDKKVIITGGAGLIGSYLADILVNCGAKVIVVDDFSKGTIKNLENSINKIEIREGNLEKFDFAKQSMEDGTLFFILASRAYGIGYSRNNHVQTLLHNEKITII